MITRKSRLNERLQEVRNLEDAHRVASSIIVNPASPDDRAARMHLAQMILVCADRGTSSADDLLALSFERETQVHLEPLSNLTQEQRGKLNLLVADHLLSIESKEQMQQVFSNLQAHISTEAQAQDVALNLIPDSAGQPGLVRMARTIVTKILLSKEERRNATQAYHYNQTWIKGLLDEHDKQRDQADSPEERINPAELQNVITASLDQHLRAAHRATGDHT